MSDVARLERQLKEARSLLSADQARAKEAPENPLMRIMAASFQRHVEDLEHQLYLAKAERSKEVFELRLHGNHLGFGSVPLRLLAQIAAPMNAAIEAAAWKLRYGQDPHHIGDFFAELLDVRLASLAAGSSRLIFTGNIAPDAVGDSLLEGTLKELFSVLNASAETFYEHVHTVGYRSARNLTALMKVLEQENVSAELSWATPESTTLRWHGSTCEIRRIHGLLYRLQEPKIAIVHKTGTVRLLSETGRIEIAGEGGRKYKICYPKNLYADVCQLKLGDEFTFVLEESSHFDETRQETISHYTLIAIAPALT